MIMVESLLHVKLNNNKVQSEELTGGCPECQGPLRRTNRETICGQCGLIVAEDLLDRGPDWRRSPVPGQSRSRAGAPLTNTRHDRGLSTEIGYGNGQSRRLTGKNRRRFARLRRQHRRAQVRNKLERNRIYGFTEIRRITTTLELPDSITERSCVLFRSAQDEDLLQGRSLEGFSAASVYANCRIEGLARTREEILTAARATAQELSNAFDAMNRELGLPVGPIDPVEYIPRFASNLSLPDSIERRARQLATKARSDGFSTGRNPCGVAAGCLYTAATEQEYPLTQDAVAEEADVAPVTVRATYKALT